MAKTEKILTSANLKGDRVTDGRKGAERVVYNLGHTASPEATAAYQDEDHEALVFPEAAWAMQNGVSVTVHANPDDPYEPVEVPASFAAVFKSSREIERDLQIRNRVTTRTI